MIYFAVRTIALVGAEQHEIPRHRRGASIYLGSHQRSPAT
jgi:hypothetical protein